MYSVFLVSYQGCRYISSKKTSLSSSLFHPSMKFLSKHVPYCNEAHTKAAKESTPNQTMKLEKMPLLHATLIHEACTFLGVNRLSSSISLLFAFSMLNPNDAPVLSPLLTISHMPTPIQVIIKTITMRIAPKPTVIRPSGLFSGSRI